MMHLLLLTTMLFYDPSVNITPYMEFLPAPCPVRIDIVNRTNIYYDAYAWYSGRIYIYDGNPSMKDLEWKRYVIQHEIGHICNKNNRRGSYYQRELNANKKIK